MGFISEERASSVQNKSLNLKQTPADIWEYDDAGKTDSPKLSLKDGWSMVDILYPIGAFYTQYPDADSSTLATAFPDASRPADMFGGTWVAQWDDEGIDFHTERTSDVGLQTRTDGLQADQFQGWQLGATADTSGARNYYGKADLRDRVNTDSGSTVANYASIYINIGFQGSSNRLKAMNDGTNGTPRTGTVTCDFNRLVRIWKRTA